MGKTELSERPNWQAEGGANAEKAEQSFFDIFTEEFKDEKYQNKYRIRKKPREFNNVYKEYQLSPEVLAEIFNPEDSDYRHGLIPDFAIDNADTKKTLYVEVKRQDGWVEGKTKSAGRGNAHERSNKLFTPGLLELLRKKGGHGEDVIPFWVIFQGDIARDPKRNSEIHFWYGSKSDHMFLWRDSKKGSPLIAHFNQKLKHLLD
jgi:hypothetical protein